MKQSKILFAQNLSANLNHTFLTQFFMQQPGFIEVRMPPGDNNQGIAFIEFSDETTASVALKTLNGFQLTPVDVLNLSLSN